MFAKAVFGQEIAFIRRFLAMASSTKKEGFDFWRSTLKSARYIVAPMVDQSELPWRMLCRRYGAHLVYTPMINANVFVRDAVYRKDMLTTCEEDRPLIVQFCASNPGTLLEAAKGAQHMCDGIDLNLGCPQAIARRGHYGAFLMEEWDLIGNMVNLLHTNLSVPVSCKIRVFPDIDKTVRYAKMLESAGCQLLTVHGRTREQKGCKTGLASWQHIRAVKAALKIPVFSNGNVRYLSDVEDCLRETGADGMMIAEGNLSNPCLFTGTQPPIWVIAEEYLKLARQYPTAVSAVRGHLFRLWHKCLPTEPDLRDLLANVNTFEELVDVSSQLTKRIKPESFDEEIFKAERPMEELPMWRCQPKIRPPPPDPGATSPVKRSHTESDELTPEQEKRMLKKLRRNTTKLATPFVPKEKRYLRCVDCTANPAGLKCEHNRCRTCCKVYSANAILDCKSHRLAFKTRHQRNQVEREGGAVPMMCDNGASSSKEGVGTCASLVQAAQTTRERTNSTSHERSMQPTSLGNGDVERTVFNGDAAHNN